MLATFIAKALSRLAVVWANAFKALHDKLDAKATQKDYYDLAKSSKELLSSLQPLLLELKA
eukprot:13248543-Alexandrium_andersonii.AAC.1